MKQNKKIHLLDSTLREGEQAANILFSLEEKLEISTKLEAFGVLSFSLFSLFSFILLFFYM